MTSPVCPWWLSYAIANRLRGVIHDPRAILGPYVKRGMTVLDLGCGMGYFSIALAKLVGPEGRVIAVDIQKQVLDVLERRARKAGVAGRIHCHRAEPDRIGVATPVDFAVAFWMLHEVPETRGFLSQVCGALKPGAAFLVIEPRFHVSREAFLQSLATAREIGLELREEPRVRLSRAALLTRRA